MTADARQELIDLYCAAVDGANVESLTTNAVASLNIERRSRVWLFAFGKAAHPMAKAAVSALHKGLADIAGGIVVGPHAAPAPFGTIVSMDGDHPIPGRRSFAAAERIGIVMTQKRGTDLGIVLISGGASSLIAAPLRGMSETDLSRLYEILLGSGLDIHGMNAVRKRFSYWAAGRMALALAPARTYCFAVSDVIGDDLSVIGSGPCVPDPTRVQSVIDLLRGHGLFDKLSATFRQYLADTARGAIPETPKHTHPAFAHVTARVIGNNGAALTAAAAAAKRSGHIPVVHEQPIAGEAADAGTRIARELIELRGRTAPGTSHCVIWGGETTVTLGGADARGGRCQELALSVARELSHAGERAAGIALLAGGTDGRDGSTDAAGAVVDGSTWAAIAASSDPEKALRAHQSHESLASVNALFEPGPTGTNVMDVVIGLVRA